MIYFCYESKDAEMPFLVVNEGNVYAAVLKLETLFRHIHDSKPWVVKDQLGKIVAQSPLGTVAHDQKGDSKMKNGTWISSSFKPPVEGVYKIRWIDSPSFGPFYAKWDGEQWMLACGSVDAAARASEKSIELYDERRPYEWRLVDDLREPMEQAKPVTATDLLNRAVQLQAERGKQYDADDNQQERSIAKTVDAFNAICGHKPSPTLTESQGWLFMCLLKMVRAESRSEPHADSVEDLVSYASLYGEARLNGK